MAFGFETDPFTQVYDKIWDMLEANSSFTDMVKIGNRIKVSGTDPHPLKKEVMDSDIPEVMILPRGGLHHINFSSSSVRLGRVYTIAITTNNLAANRYLFPLEWIIFGVFVSSNQTLDLTFKATYELSQSDQTIEDILLNRGVEGWASTIDIIVTIVINKSIIVQE